MIQAERREALHQAMIDRDFPVIEEALRGDDLALRRAALRAVRTLPVSDDAAAAVLTDASLELRRAFYRTLLHARRTALADRLLPSVRRQWGEGEAAALLPACSTEVAADQLPGLAHAVGSWTQLARRHPEAVLAHIESGDPALGLGYPFWRRWETVLTVLAVSLPERTIAFLGTQDTRYGLRLPARAMTALVKADPIGAKALVASDDRPRTDQLRYRAVEALDDAGIIAYVDGDVHTLWAVLGHLPPARREGLADAFAASVPDREPMWAEPLLDVLPAARAEAEARRMLEWHRSQWHPVRGRSQAASVELTLASHLPIAEAVAVLTEAAGSGTSTVRVAARSLLLERVARTESAAEVLRQVEVLVTRVLNEPDPVRDSFLQALGRLPVAVFGDDWVPVLDRLATAVIEARDCSEHTRRSLRILAGRTLRHQTSPGLPAWAFDVYRQLVVRFGAAGLDVPTAEELDPPPAPRRRRVRAYRPPAPPDDWRLDLALLPGQERELVAVLRPWLDDADVVSELRRALGRRAENCPELPELPASAAAPTRSKAVQDTKAAEAPEALGEAEAPEAALPRLLAEANGQHSPDAVADLAACCARVRPSVLGPALESALFAPDSKITLRKQAVRQLRRNRIPGHLDVLLRAWQQPDTHRDVRVTIATVLRGATEEPRALETVAASVRPGMSELMIRTLFQPHPRQFPPDARAAYAALVRDLLRASDKGGVRFRGLKAFGVWAPWYRGGVDELIDTLFGPDGNDADLASQLLWALFSTGSGVDRAPEVLRRLADDPAHSGHASTLATSIGGLRNKYRSPAPEPWTLELVQRSLAALISEPGHVRFALPLALALVDPAADDLDERLVDYADLLAGRPYLAGLSENSLREQIADRQPPRPPARLLAAARTLADRGDLAGGLVAGQIARLVAAIVPLDASWREAVATLRASAHLEVAEAARDITFRKQGEEVS